MKTIWIVVLACLVACGCQKSSGYTVDKNDPGSVENASKVKPVTIDQNGNTVDGTAEQAPPGK